MDSFITASPEEAEEVAKWIIGLIREHRHKHILLQGDLGAGKTTIIRHIIRLLGSVDIAVSPTFSLHNSYKAGDGSVILHSDLYRLNSLAELEQTGFFELLDEADLAFIEWPDKFALKDMLARYLEIRIIKGSDTVREYFAELQNEHI